MSEHVATIEEHEGKKYLKRIVSAVVESKGLNVDLVLLPDGRVLPTCMVDVYAVIEAWEVTCPGRQHALKKILAAGERGKGSAVDDLRGAIAALNRAVELELARMPKIDERCTVDTLDTTNQRNEKFRTQIPIRSTTHILGDPALGTTWEEPAHIVKPHWEVCPAYDPPIDPSETLQARNAVHIGYRVRWSEPDAERRYFWNRHYLTDGQPGDPSLAWCQNAATRDAQRMNDEGRTPKEWVDGQWIGHPTDA
jgi:hypothetical protein